jgi:hypothetical protein
MMAAQRRLHMARYEIRKGASKPCELVSIVETQFGGEVVNFICEGTHTQCASVRDMLLAMESKTNG